MTTRHHCVAVSDDKAAKIITAPDPESTTGSRIITITHTQTFYKDNRERRPRRGNKTPPPVRRLMQVCPLRQSSAVRHSKIGPLNDAMGQFRPTRSKRHVSGCPLRSESDLPKSKCDPSLRANNGLMHRSKRRARVAM